MCHKAALKWSVVVPNTKVIPYHANKEEKGKLLRAASGAVDEIPTINLKNAALEEYLITQQMFPN